MDTKLISHAPSDFATPLLAVFAVDAAPEKSKEHVLDLLINSEAISNAAAKVLASGEFKAALGETVIVHAPAGLKAERLLVVGLGKAKSLSLDELRKGGGTAIRAASRVD